MLWPDAGVAHLDRRIPLPEPNVITDPFGYCNDRGTYQASGAIMPHGAMKSHMGPGNALIILDAPDTWPGQANDQEDEEEGLEEALDKNPGLAKEIECMLGFEDACDDSPYPRPADVTIPDCDGMLYATCADLIEQQGLQPQRSDLDWSVADVTRPADAVVQTNPASGNQVDFGSQVTVVTNPNEAGMPFVIPTPGAHETYQDYLERLAEGKISVRRCRRSPTRRSTRRRGRTRLYGRSRSRDGITRTTRPRR